MAYTLLFNKTDTLAATLLSGATATTLTTGNFGSPSGQQLYVVDWDVPAKAEIILASITTTAVTSITRGLAGGASGTTDHAIGAKIASIFVPQHYLALVDGSGLTLGSLPNNVILANALSTTAITLGYAEITSNFTSTTTGSDADITGLTTTVTVPAGSRKLKITGFLPGVNTTAAAGTTVDIRIKEGATTLATARYQQPVTGYNVPITVFAANLTPSAGSHTYKIAFQSGAAGTFTVNATAPASFGVAFIVVELM